MKTGRRTTDWKPEASPRASEGERRGDDRRALDRRAPRRGIDPMFAATLVNQIAPATELTPASSLSYFGASPAPRPGRVLNLRA